jgi:hypothetical protein
MRGYTLVGSPPIEALGLQVLRSGYSRCLPFFLAALSYEFVEKPFLRLKDHFQGERKPIFSSVSRAGLGRPRALDRNAKVRIIHWAPCLSRRTEKGRAYGAVTAKALAVLEEAKRAKRALSAMRKVLAKQPTVALNR